MWTRRPSELLLVASLTLVAVDARAVPPPAATMDDPIAQYRERFKQGMDRYKAGAPAEAVGYWEPIYRELGEQKGYRLAYNLGVAYSELGDTTRAAERLESFLGQVEARRTRGEAIASIVTKEEADARERVTAFVATKGRIHVDAGTPPRAAQVDASEPRLAGFVRYWTWPPPLLRRRPRRRALVRSSSRPRPPRRPLLRPLLRHRLPSSIRRPSIPSHRRSSC
jgi:hypothetical protein